MKSIATGQDFKCEGQQGVSCKNCRGLSEFLMAGWHSTPEVIVIHCGKIIVDQRIGMHHFDGSTDWQNGLDITVKDREPCETQCGPKSFSTGKHAVSHCTVNLRRRG